MKNENLEKYISELSPELQENARECKTKEELIALAAENDIELSEDALQAVAGGCGEPERQKGDPVNGKFCPLCNQQLYYYSHAFAEDYLYCNNVDCKKYIYAPGIYPSGNRRGIHLWCDDGKHLTYIGSEE